MKQTEAQWQSTLRFAVGVTAAFVLCEFLKWLPSFLAAALVAALLGNLPIRPPAKVAIGLLVTISVSALGAFLLSVWFRGMPFVMFGLLAVWMLLAFHKMLGGGSPLPPLLMLICLATIPVITLTAPAYADVLPIALVRGMVVALAIIYLVWLPWPAVQPPKPKPLPPPRETSTLRLALLATAVILPLMLVFLLFGLADVLPVMIASLMIVANFDPRAGGRQALALIVANFGGGMCGMLLYIALSTTPSLWFLAGLLFFATLAFGARISAGGPTAPVYVIACNAMLIIFGSSLGDSAGSFSLWVTRVFQFTVAGTFAVGMMELAWHPPVRLLPLRAGRSSGSSPGKT
ncbi:hypothetical protein LYSHEL_22470 [Lysobacter helvus]|uniref:DUF2955 domain-containing protein n=2 Tax=Lysobacteraceae TaxID=32033 RepID=A0ABM7Q738_9GAMM|nr:MULTISPECIES: DUF2955 domain-containing protein [Lysobacter]BCT93224.1 hypothetical protein LYSCAS_22480 [Lysobacter caseinilyticus]BCT96376.1 hypothetical protein LYSHEL_22470 [Lysobacter helvus]